MQIGDYAMPAQVKSANKKLENTNAKTNASNNNLENVAKDIKFPSREKYAQNLKAAQKKAGNVLPENLEDSKSEANQNTSKK